MSEQLHGNSSRREEAAEEVGATALNGVETEINNDDIDAVLDEIDDVLEENAEEFVKGFVQKGGQ
jgi:ubiquitin-like protein Pup